MDFLARVLEGREGRARSQARFFEEGLTVVQVSLNVPGFPKRLDGDLFCIEQAGLKIREKVLSEGGRVALEVGLLNGAGYALLLGVRLEGSAVCLKKACIALEEDLPWGRALDLDVLTPWGGIDRRSLGEPPRKCLLCGDEAKTCSRESRHDRVRIREAMRELLVRCLQEGGSSTSF
jgi:holo-ACP synthase CitX